MPRPSDKQSLISDINSAIADLEALKGEVCESSIRSMRDQAESARAYVRHAQRVMEICGGLTVNAVCIAAALGETKIHPTDLKGMRVNECAEEALSEALEWADEIEREIAA